MTRWGCIVVGLVALLVLTACAAGKREVGVGARGGIAIGGPQDLKISPAGGAAEEMRGESPEPSVAAGFNITG